MSNSLIGSCCKDVCCHNASAPLFLPPRHHVGQNRFSSKSLGGYWSRTLVQNIKRNTQKTLVEWRVCFPCFVGCFPSAALSWKSWCKREHGSFQRAPAYKLFFFPLLRKTTHQSLKSSQNLPWSVSIPKIFRFPVGVHWVSLLMQLVFNSCPDLRDHFQIIYDLLDKTVAQDGQKTIRTQWACNGRRGWICTRYRMVVWYSETDRTIRIQNTPLEGPQPSASASAFADLQTPGVIFANLLLISGAQRSAVS